MSARVSSTQGYAAEADKLAESYETLTFEGVHREVLHLMPSRPCRVLDIGAGTGRDAAAFAARGHQVTAMEPTAELRAHGERLHAAANITWVDDSLPDLARLRAAGAPFDLVMATAVWMHLDMAERTAAIGNVASLVAPGGQFILSLRYGPVPPGRRMFAVTAEETIALAAECGLSLVHRSGRADMFGRGDVSWTFLAFGKMTERT
jgi:2-polyprenyl-3-methyl-5-hydroxy-6-metoxy-1,4-benzoquinol methylase